MHRIRIDKIRSDAFNLSEDELAARERNGYDQYDAGAANDDAQHRQESAKFIGAQGVKSNDECLSPKHASPSTRLL